jgi:mono/diheme cytochrome c family protein
MTRTSKIPKKRIALYAGIVLVALAGRLAWDEYLVQRYAWRLPPALEREVSFAEDIAPILEAHCWGCHNPEEPRGEYDMTTREALIAGGETGAAVRIGNARRSLFMHLLVARGEEWKMPPDGDRLTDDEVARLRTWIEQGLPWEPGLSHLPQ